MTPEVLAATAGIVISIGFEYIPGVHDWYNGLSNTYQRLLMLGVMFAIVAVMFGLGCANLIKTWECTTPGALEALKCFGIAMIANQSTYTVLPKMETKVQTRLE